MKVLVVHSGNHKQVAPFIVEQAEALREAGCEVQLFAVEGHGIQGYLHCLPSLKRAIAEYRPDIVHAHYGLCGLLCTLQRKVPVVITYHGSDINNKTSRRFSLLAMRRAAYNIFVSKKLSETAKPSPFKGGVPQRGVGVIPCGIDTHVFHPMPHEEAIKVLEQKPIIQAIKQSNNQAIKFVLFAGAFDNEVKNPQLAKETCALVPDAILLELKGYSRTEVAALMNIVDMLLMTSHSEGSPQVVKEALACGLPVVSVDVGDVAETTSNVANCRIVKDKSPLKLADAIESVIKSSHRIQTDISKFDNREIARQLVQIYKCAIA